MKINKILWVIPIFMVLVIVLTMNPSKIEACDCAVPETATEALGDATAVFKGEVIKIKEEKINGEQYDVVLMSVSEIWKGLEDSQVLIYTDWSSCHFIFEVGSEYLLYPNENNGRLHVIDCGRSAKVNEAQDDLLELGQGEKPSNMVHLDNEFEDKQTYVVVFLAALFVVVALVIFLIVYLYRRRK